MGKRAKEAFPYLYAMFIILILPLLYRSHISWRNASLADYVLEFSNIIPLHGITNGIKNAINTQKTYYLKPLFFNFLKMIPIGLFYGCSMHCIELKTAGLVCVKCGVLFSLLYCVRTALRLGSFDVDDVLLNLVGLFLGMIGMLILCQINQRIKGNGKE